MEKTKLYFNKFFVQTDAYLVAKIYTVSSTISMTIAQTISKTSTLSPQQNMYIRAIILCCFNRYMTKQDIYVEDKYKSQLLMIASFIFGLQAITFFIALDLLSLAETVIIFSSFSIWSQFAARILLGEQLSARRLVTCFIAILGIVIMSKPAFLYGKLDYDENHFFGCILILAASIGFAISGTMIKMMGDTPAEAKIQAFQMNILIFCSLSFIQKGDYRNEIYTIHNFIMVILFASFSYICHILSYKAFAMVSIAKLSPYMNINIIIMLFLDFLMFGILPDINQIIGSVLILASIILNPKDNLQEEKSKLQDIEPKKIVK